MSRDRIEFLEIPTQLLPPSDFVRYPEKNSTGYCKSPHGNSTPGEIVFGGNFGELRNLIP